MTTFVEKRKRAKLKEESEGNFLRGQDLQTSIKTPRPDLHDFNMTSCEEARSPKTKAWNI